MRQRTCRWNLISSFAFVCFLLVARVFWNGDLGKDEAIERTQRHGIGSQDGTIAERVGDEEMQKETMEILFQAMGMIHDQEEQEWNGAQSFLSVGEEESLRDSPYRQALETLHLQPRGKTPPKLAFLFLTRGPMDLEMLWQLFFTGIPKELYNVYLHAAPGFEYNQSTTRTDVFLGRGIPSKTVDWGQMSMIDAEKRLLKAGLEDVANERFILLSESCIPLRSFSYTYDYLMGQSKSFIESYSTDLPGRYDPNMGPMVKGEDFRKGGQWFALIRGHARLVHEEKQVYEVFQKHCYWDWGLNKLCAPDETYIQTTLSVLKRESEIHPRGVTFTEWYPTTRVHPKRYVIQEVSREFVWDLQSRRQIWGPDIHPDRRSLHPLERPQSQRLGGGQYRPEKNIACGWGSSEYAPCWLFARKFSAKSGQRILRFASSIHLGNMALACATAPMEKTESCSIFRGLRESDSGQDVKPYSNHFYDAITDQYLVRGSM